MTNGSATEADGRPDPILLTEPRDGLPRVTDSPADVHEVAERFRAGSGPVAVDAERASGYRYGAHAYLVQLRREGAGTALIDPILCPDLSELGAATRDEEWILHAASQDLACLAELGLVPSRLFDTELAGRLLGYPRVALGTLVEELLGFHLEKGHSAADWSTRPLPEPWLRYAALDVELLVELRNVLAGELEETGKAEWAREEFEALRTAPPPPAREDPWRRVSGLHQIRKSRQLAVVRELWQRRDRLAERRNIAPGRVLPDAAIVAAALAVPTTEDELGQLAGFRGKATRRSLSTWFKGIEAARALRPSKLPPLAGTGHGPPSARSWPSRFPEAAARLAACREAVGRVSDDVTVPVENLLAPDTVRRLAWAPPHSLNTEAIAAELRSSGARSWQITLTAEALATALRTERDGHDAPRPLHASPPVRAEIAVGRIRLVPLDGDTARALIAGRVELPAGLHPAPGWPHDDTPDALVPALATGTDDALPWLVTVDNAVIGDLGWKGGPDSDGTVEIGYGLAVEARGHGYGAEAVSAFVTWLAALPSVRCIRAEVLADNVASRRILEHCGFRREPSGDEGDLLAYSRPSTLVTGE